MKTYTTITDLTNALSESLDLDWDATLAAIRQHSALFRNYGPIPHREIAALSRAVFETVTGAEYPTDWAIRDSEIIDEEKGFDEIIDDRCLAAETNIPQHLAW